MHVHHLNCGCMCPLGGALFDGYSRGLTASVVCHCVLIETDTNGLILVDTGFGQQDIQHPERLSCFFRAFNNIQLKHRFTAIDQIRRMGFDVNDVRHIILTHLDFDHAGGLQDFPRARVHVMLQELNFATLTNGWFKRRRFVPAQWRGVEDWELYAPDGDTWFGFDSVRAVLGAQEEDILLVPLRGHTTGHAGVAIRTAEGWSLHAGDAYFHHDEVHLPKRRCPAGMHFYQRLMDADHQARMHNQQRLRQLATESRMAVNIFCSHDAREFQQVTNFGSSGFSGSLIFNDEVPHP